MRRLIASGILVVIIYAAVLLVSTAVVAAPNSFSGLAQYFSPQQIGELFNGITGDWSRYGHVFTHLQANLFWKVFLAVLTVVPGVFLLHFLVIGAKSFSHDGPQILFFGSFTRLVHWLGALSFTLLVVTGLLVIFGSFFGGGSPIRFARYIHIASAIVFAIDALFMFLIWLRDMLPAPHDLLWLFMVGGYLSRQKRPVPAGKFNAGQKAWFWLATAGGGVMAYTGYAIWSMAGNLDLVRLFAIIHNVLGMMLVAFFLTHVYMSLFAIRGSLTSMITGYKPKEEVDILHSRYNYRQE